MTHDPAPIWTRLQAELRRRVSDATFDIWLAPLRCESVEDDRIVVVAPSDLRAWVQQRFARVIAEAIEAVLGPDGPRLELRGDDRSRPARAAAAPPAPAVPAEDERTRLNPKFTFEQFVIGDANRFAHAAALAVAELPGQAYNPLFIVGPPGVGKTHLLHSIGNYVRQYGGGMTVRYTTVERFTNDFIESLQTRDVEAFKRRYRRNDVLLIDDVQFLESKVKTEEEFFHTFNAVMETGSQLVLTSDRLPRDMAVLEERLRERFESGLLVDIGAPDRDTRLTVLRKRVHHDDLQLADDGVLDLLADRVTTNVRALEGALIRVVAYASLTDQPISTPLAEKVLADLYGRGPRRPGGGSPRPGAPVTIERIQHVVAEAFGVTREELLSPNRTARVAWPRQVAMYLAREHTQESLPTIGARFGGRDHSTVHHACRRAAERMSDDPEAFDAIRALTDRLLGPDDDRRG
ncbi:MAG: chromosomal replication initiator protein DnaA [Solirubrobacterales bacterium]|nr:chromosomal replication initiator protein DnaA [Solirubrobacterales bacterium]